MSEEEESKILTFLQPELMTPDQLIEIIKSARKTLEAGALEETYDQHVCHQHTWKNEYIIGIAKDWGTRVVGKWNKRIKQLERWAKYGPKDLNGETVLQRCPKVQNVTALSKDRLVRLFRQTVLPLPQRQYRTNRGGKLLTARRRKAGLEQGEGDTSTRSCEKRPNPKDRLKPENDSCMPNKIRIASPGKSSGSSDLDKIVINDRRRKNCETKEDDSRQRDDGNLLKRASSDADKRCERRPSDSSQPAKKQRTGIKWP